jgi:hypothetical protein
MAYRGKMLVSRWLLKRGVLGVTSFSSDILCETMAINRLRIPAATNASDEAVASWEHHATATTATETGPDFLENVFDGGLTSTASHHQDSLHGNTSAHHYGEWNSSEQLCSDQDWINSIYFSSFEPDCSADHAAQLQLQPSGPFGIDQTYTSYQSPDMTASRDGNPLPVSGQARYWVNECSKSVLLRLLRFLT